MDNNRFDLLCPFMNMACVTTSKSFGPPCFIQLWNRDNCSFLSQRGCEEKNLYLSVTYPNTMTVVIEEKDGQKIIKRKRIRILGQIIISART